MPDCPAPSTAPQPPLLREPPVGLGRLWLNLQQARFNRHELAGSLGDLGLFVPLLLALSTQCGLDFATGLFFAGLFNLLTGLLFTVPIPVQPMKVIAAVALTQGLTVHQLVAAGMIVSVLVGLIGWLGWADGLTRLVPWSVIRGLQLAIGLMLASRGLQMVADTGQWFGWDSYLVGLGCGLLVLLPPLARRVPAALVLLAIGLGLALAQRPELLGTLELGLTLPAWSPPTWADFAVALPDAALPQLPLTLLNSVIAVCVLSGDLFPSRALNPRAVAMSVGAMNLLGGWFAAMPMCHGAGGLAGQYRFGARTNGAILMLGAVKLLLAVALGASLMPWCQAFPASILGVLLLFASVELASVCRDQTAKADATVMLVTAAVGLGLNQLLLGLAVGLVLAWGQRAGLLTLTPPDDTATAPRSHTD